MSIPSEIIARLNELRAENGNEANTRFKIIDEILLDVLRWEKDDLKLEERVSEDGKESFLDYLVQTAQTSFLIEAKRVQIDFSRLPAARRVALRGSWMKGDLGKAIHQAKDYGRKRGVGFCAITNGDAWILFPVNRRDLVSFEDTFAIVFQSAKLALETDIDEFCGLLARQSVIDGSLEQNLLGGDSNQIDNRRFNRIYDRSFSKINRTTMFSEIEDEIVTAFSEELIAQNPELLEKAYVETADRIRFDDRVKMAVLRRDQVISTRPMRPVGREGVDAAAGRVLETKVRAQPIALLTLGLVGAGKTTFLNYVEKVSGKDFFEQNRSGFPKAHWLYVDFRAHSQSVSPRERIYNSIFEYIGKNPALGDYEKTVQFAYRQEIDALKRGPLAALKADEAAVNEKISELVLKEYEQRVPYCGRILKYVSQKAPIFLVIDNVDQIESIGAQETIFLEALAVARENHLNLVLAMRDATYVKNKTSAVFDAFTFDAIYIDPPHIQSVLSKRFAIAEHLLRGKTFDITTDGGVKVTIGDASRIIEMLSASVLGTEVGTLIEVTATGDVRLALLMTKQFLQFGYSASFRAYAVFQNSGKYVFPTHEAVRAIMFGNQSIYRDEFSPIINPFDAKTGRSESQFLRLLVMSALVSAASTKTFQGLEAGEITKSLERIGFSQRISNKVMTDLVAGRVCFSRSHQEFGPDSVLVPTRLCGYIVRDLIGKLIFLETTIFDTFIYDDAVWNDLKLAMKGIYNEARPVEKFRKRKSMAKVFFDWLEREVQKLCYEAAKRNLGPIWTHNPLSRLRAEFEAELERAFRSAVKNYGTEKEKELLGLPLFKDNGTSVAQSPETGEGVN